MKRPLRLLLDGPNISHGLRHAIKLNTNSGRPTGVLVGWINTLSKLDEMFHPDEIIVVWETEERSWRYRRYPEYKGARRKRRKEQSELEQQELKEFFRIQLPDTIKALYHLGIPQIAVPGLEADDILGLVPSMSPEHDSTQHIVVSTDKDMLQLARYDQVRIYNAYADKIYHQLRNGKLAVNGRENTILAPSPNTYLLWRTIIGDTSDSLPGISGVGQKTVEQLYGNLPFETKDWGVDDINRYITSVDLTGKRGQALLKGTEQILRNIELMRLAYASIPRELLSASARTFVKCFDRSNPNIKFAKTAPKIPYPLFLAYPKHDPSPMLNFFRKREFDFAFRPIYWEQFIRKFRNLLDRRNKMREKYLINTVRPIPIRSKKHVWEVTP